VEDFEGRVGVITGAANGIGRAMAVRFVAAGMRVVLVDIDEELDSVAAELEKSGGQVMAVHADVTDRAAVQDVAERTVARFGVVNLVALNAGVGGLQHTTSLTPDMWDWQLSVNIGGVVNGIIAFLPFLIEAADGGHLLLTSSLGAVLGPPYLAPYALAKAGLVGLAESLFFEMQSEGINVGVSVLCPGPVASAIAEDERHRPAGLPSRRDVDPALDEARAQLREAELNGVSPAAVAEQVVEGIRASRLYIFTHPEWTEQAVRTRCAAMVDGHNPRLPVLPDVE
jgi:pentatricopeptide repeat protein